MVWVTQGSLHDWFNYITQDLGVATYFLNLN